MEISRAVQVLQNPVRQQGQILKTLNNVKELEWKLEPRFPLQ
jgi:hypothetical protein